MLNIHEKWYQDFLLKSDTLKKWYEEHLKNIKIPLYSSVDLRDALFKIAPVDHNVFSSGFNNLSENAQKRASEYFYKEILTLKKDTSKVALLAEPHTSNKYYLDHLFILTKILKTSGFKVFPCVLQDLPNDLVSLDTFSFGKLEMWQAHVRSENIEVGGEKMDFLILNNDFSGGFNKILEEINIPIEPSYKLGWYQRRKHLYLIHYEKLLKNMCQVFGWDPWLFSTYYERIENVDIKEGRGLSEISEAADKILLGTESKYKEYGIVRKPFVLLKYNAGTYGMGIITIYSGKDVFQLNRKQREQMSYGKGKQNISDILVQEGVPTSKKIGDCIGEPVIYLIGSKPVGGFHRIHCDKSAEESLNAPGMHFKPFCFDQDYWDAKDSESALYGFISSLSALAVGYETVEYAETLERSI